MRQKLLKKIIRVDELNEPGLGLGFKRKKGSSYQYVISYHNFQANMQVLNILANSKFSSVPVVGGFVFPSYWRDVQDLFNNWDAQVRYRNDILSLYTERQILNFFKLSSELYTGIRICITN